MFKMWFAACVPLLAAVAGAQVIYEPIQHDDAPVYHGGAESVSIDSATQDDAKALGAPGLPYFHRSFGYIPLPSPLYPGVGNKIVDAYPVARCTHHSAYCLGCSADDVRAGAYRSIPRYFRKSDLLREASEENGTVRVPAAPRPRPMIEIRLYAAPAPASAPTTRPSRTAPRSTTPDDSPAPVLIIPKPPTAPVQNGPSVVMSR